MAAGTLVPMLLMHRVPACTGIDHLSGMVTALWQPCQCRRSFPSSGGSQGHAGVATCPGHRSLSIVNSRGYRVTVLFGCYIGSFTGLLMPKARASYCRAWHYEYPFVSVKQLGMLQAEVLVSTNDCTVGSVSFAYGLANSATTSLFVVGSVPNHSQT
jgi:hypothetical protein